MSIVPSKRLFKKLFVFYTFIILLVTTIALVTAQEVKEAPAEQARGLLAVGIGLATGLAAAGAGIGAGIAGAAAISAVSEKREMFGISLLFVVIAEGVAAYGIAIAFILPGLAGF